MRPLSDIKKTTPEAVAALLMTISKSDSKENGMALVKEKVGSICINNIHFSCGIRKFLAVKTYCSCKEMLACRVLAGGFD